MADNQITRVMIPSYLQSLTIGFVPMGMIADRVSPRIPVAVQSGKYRVFGKNNLIQRKADWHPGMIPNAIETRWSSGSFYAEIYKLRQLILDAERVNNASAVLGGIPDLEGVYTQNVTNALAIAREKRIATLFTTPANYPGANVITKAGGAEWNIVGGEQIFTDLITLAGTVADAAMVPMAELSAVIPEPVFRTAMMRNTALLDAIKYTQRGVITEDMLASLLGIKEVIISRSMTAGAGLEIAGADVVTGYTASYLWLDTVWIGLIAEGQNQMVPTFSRTFNWTAATGGQVRQVRTYRSADEGQQADWIEVLESVDEQITFSGAGGIIVNTLSTI
jgi:hypothetical protein